MKRFLSVFLALAVAGLTATVAFAAGGEKEPSGHYSGVAVFDEKYVSPGGTVYLDIDYFYGSWKEDADVWDANKQEYVEKKVTVDNQDYPIGSLDKEYHTVTASWTSGGQYIQSVYFEDGDDEIAIEIKGGFISTVDREIRGTIRILERNYPNRPSVTYTCKIPKEALIIEASDEKTRIIDWGSQQYGLPSDYQDAQVRFSTDEGDNYGTFIGEFDSQKDGSSLAEYRVRISGQTPLYLGFSESENKTVAKNYPSASLRYINWTARPTFDYSGKLSIYMDSDEYIYGINDDNTLYSLGGSYDASAKAYVVTTKTLGSYVISDTRLTAGGSGGGSAATSPSSASVSSAAPSSAAPSSTAPPPSSSPAPPPSSVEPSSDPEEEPSEPEDSEPEETSSSSMSDPGDADDGDGDDEKEPAGKKKFPLVPALFGVLGVVILVCAVVVVGNRNSGSRARSRRRRYDDDWDD